MCAQTGDYKYVHTSVIPLTDNSAAKLIRQCPNGDDVTGGGVENSGTGLGSKVGGTAPTTENGGTLSFRAKLNDGKPRRILKNLEFDNVPINCDQGPTTHNTVLKTPCRSAAAPSGPPSSARTSPSTRRSSTPAASTTPASPRTAPIGSTATW